MNIDRLEQQLARCVFGHTVYFYSTCPSTQDLTHTLALTHRTGTLVVAAEQSAGRGRHSRPWFERRHSSITASFLLKDPLWTASAPAFSLLAGLAVLEAVEQQAPQWQDRLHLKWPNDVVVRMTAGHLSKLAGILVEGRISPAGQGHAVLGIGINVNQSKGELPIVDDTALPPVSLRVLTDKVQDRTRLLKLLCQSLERYLYQNRQDHSRRRIWDTRLITLGATVTVREGTDEEPTLKGIAVATTSRGNLIIKDHNGQEHELEAADIMAQTVP